jgi:ribosomal protein L23
VAKKLAPADRTDPKKNKSLAIRKVLELDPNGTGAEIAAQVEKTYGHKVKPNVVYITRAKVKGFKKRRKAGRPKAAAGQAEGNMGANGAATKKPSNSWVGSIHLARQLIKAVGGVRNAVALVEAIGN